jgi:hypothetical protein
VKSYIARQIDSLSARLLMLHALAGRDITREQARQQAIREVVAEERARRATQPATPPLEQLKYSNPKEYFLRCLAALHERLRTPITRGVAPADVRKATLPETGKLRPRPTHSDISRTRQTSSALPNLVLATKFPETGKLPVEPAPQHVGVYAGNSTGASLIDDAEFHRSVTFADEATNNWRRSIALNEQIQARRESGRWIG